AQPRGAAPQRVGAGAGGAPRRRGVEEEQPARVLDGLLGSRQSAQEIEGRLERGAERPTAVLVRERELAAHHQELALAGIQQLAAQALFDRLRRAPLRAPSLDAAGAR